MNDYHVRFQNLPLGGDSLPVSSHKSKLFRSEKILPSSLDDTQPLVVQ